jgi:hypothetical protein
VGDDRFRFWPAGGVGERVERPALLAWLLVIMPAVIEAQNSHSHSHTDASTAYLLAASQALALPRQQPA